MLYEGVIVFDSSLADADIGAQLDRVEAIISGHSDASGEKGQVSKRDVWGRRQLAYKIGKKDYGIYTYLVFSGTSGLVADMRRQLRINDAVIRFLIVKKDKFAPDLIRPPASDTYSSSRESYFGGRDGFGGDRFGSDRDGPDRFGGDAEMAPNDSDSVA